MNNIGPISEQSPATLFQHLYRTLNRDTLSIDMLGRFYHHDITFIDPYHNFTGLEEVHRYFDGLYANVEDIQFEFHNTWSNTDKDGNLSLVINWTMIYQHPKIAAGRPVTVDGLSELNYSGLYIVRQRDYFDTSQALFEHLPLLGSAIRFLKRRMS